MMEALLTDYTLRTVALGAAVLGATAGALGTFAVLRGQSLVGDAVSHAALPGVVLAFLVTGGTHPLALVVGAALAGWAGMAAVGAVTRHSRIPFDAALALALAVFFGIGLMLLVGVQRRPEGAQSGLVTFLFGQAAAMLSRDVAVMAGVGVGALAVLAAFWKELVLLAFDPGAAAALGLPVRRLDALLTTLVVVAVAIGLQTVGVVLMSALLVAPAAAARQWTDRVGRMTLLAAAVGAGSGVAGTVWSALVPRLPTGPAVVLVATAVVGVSLFVAPQRGLLAGALRARRARATLGGMGTLQDLFTLAEAHPGNPHHAHPEAVLRTMTATPDGVAPDLAALASRGLAERAGDGWRLTPDGLRRAREMARVSPDPDTPRAR